MKAAARRPDDRGRHRGGASRAPTSKQHRAARAARQLADHERRSRRRRAAGADAAATSTCKYGADGEALEHALIDRRRGHAAGRRRRAAPGRQITRERHRRRAGARRRDADRARSARDNVQLTLPAGAGRRRRGRFDRRQTLDSTGDAGARADAARSSPATSQFRERGADVDRAARVGDARRRARARASSSIERRAVRARRPLRQDGKHDGDRRRGALRSSTRARSS